MTFSPSRNLTPTEKMPRAVALAAPRSTNWLMRQKTVASRLLIISGADSRSMSRCSFQSSASRAARAG